MIRPMVLAPLLCAVLSFLSVQLLDAQTPYVVSHLTLSAYALRYTGPQVFSSADATLYGSRGQRLYEEIILGHQVRDVTLNYVIYLGRFVWPNGYASNSMNAQGVFYHCYDATIGIHVNVYGIHDAYDYPQQCITETIDVQPDPPPKEYCPILLDLALNGFHLSGPNPAVRFDIDADGTPDEIAWTQAGADDAFLCWDRNHNGAIDDGRELFGYAAPLLSGRPAKVGYRALAELDQPELGGNQDGKVDAHDAIFGELCAWIDSNRDGVSQPAEIHSLDEVGVAALEYDYRQTRMWDQYGNLFRYVSRAEMRTPSGGLRPWPTYDVIFAAP